MTRIRFVRDDLSASVFVVLVVIAALGGVIIWLAKRREARGDWGPGLVETQGEPEGYQPADLRRDLTTMPVADPGDRWLLGLAAPLVEHAALLHGRWSLVPADCDPLWRRHLRRAAQQGLVTRHRDWKQTAERLENELNDQSAHAVDADTRIFLTVQFAMVLRLGVALRHTNGNKARRRLARASLPVAERFSGWKDYGDAFLRAAERMRADRIADLRADTAMLYAPGGPWHESARPG